LRSSSGGDLEVILEEGAPFAGGVTQFEVAYQAGFLPCQTLQEGGGGVPRIGDSLDASPARVVVVEGSACPAVASRRAYRVDLHRPQLAAGPHEVSPLAEGQDG